MPAALALLSAALLAAQVVLLHLLAITHWAHFASLVIGLALLGFGASGSLLAVLAHRLRGRERAAFAVAALLSALAFDPAYRIATAIRFDAFELLAVPGQFLKLALSYAVLSLPFFLGASAIALAFVAGRERVAGLYAANLLGSGLGGLLGLALLELLPAERLPAAIGLVGALALVPLARAGVAAPAAVLALALVLPPPRVPVSSYKDESMALALPGAATVALEDGALGRLRMVAAPTLRHLPGASLALDRPVPARPVIFLNGQPLGARALPEDAALHAMTTGAAAFAVPLARDASVLVVGLGGGGEVHLARARGAASVTVLDPDARLETLVAPATLGPDVRRVHAGARTWLRGSRERFDRIVVTQTGSLGGVAAGMGAAGEDYLFTVEGVRDVWRRLSDRGLLAVTRWVLEPPRDVVRLLATARTVLGDEGLDAARHVALVRGWGTATLLLSRAPLAAPQVSALTDWAAERWFDVAWAPGAPPEAANRFNVLEPDWFRAAAEGLLGPAPEAFLERYPFEVAPVTDDAPFFHHFLAVPDAVRLLRSEGRLGLPYVEWGLVAQALALAQAVPLAAILILAPLLALPRPRAASAGGRSRLFGYFALLGVGFMLLEISSIQRLVLFLGRPVYATAAVLTAFLVFAAAGSASATALARRGAARFLPFAGVALLAPAAYVAQDWLLDHAAGAALPARMALACAVLAPLAFWMGMPFPLGLSRVAALEPGWLPWCWGVNGFLSVVGAAAAPLLAVAVGFGGVIAVAVAAYLLAGLLFSLTI
ncbi:MAG TPA: hypothetical protein VIC56_06080 [Gemmatimonadota bacterium]